MPIHPLRNSNVRCNFLGDSLPIGTCNDLFQARTEIAFRGCGSVIKMPTAMTDLTRARNNALKTKIPSSRLNPASRTSSSAQTVRKYIYGSPSSYNVGRPQKYILGKKAKIAKCLRLRRNDQNLCKKRYLAVHLNRAVVKPWNLAGFFKSIRKNTGFASHHNCNNACSYRRCPNHNEINTVSPFA